MDPFSQWFSRSSSKDQLPTVGGSSAPLRSPRVSLGHQLSLRMGFEQGARFSAPAAGPAATMLRFLDERPTDVIREGLAQFPDEMSAVCGRVIQKAAELGEVVLRPHKLKDELDVVMRTSPRAPSLASSELVQLLHEQLQEVVVCEGGVLCLAFRVTLREWEYVELAVGEQMYARNLTVEEFLQHKERLAGVDCSVNPFDVFEINMAPFSAEFPRIASPRGIGDGVTFLNRHLSSYFFRQSRAGGGHGPGSDGVSAGTRLLVDWMHQHAKVALRPDGLVSAPEGHTGGGGDTYTSLLDPHLIPDACTLEKVLRKADRYLDQVPDQTPAAQVAAQLRTLGLHSGWGSDVGRIRSSVQLAAEIMQAPSAEMLATFLSRLALINTAVILTPHGFFAQRGVLGLPDTGGQVVYILDQVRALEAEMRARLRRAGLPPEAARILVVTRLIPDSPGTTCGEVWEPIAGCESAAILRVPFRNPDGSVLREWVSRFDIYPFLERFALDVEKEVLARLGKAPDLIIGNYTDGNLVATLLTRRLGSMQCFIAHALEMTKYTSANLRWRSLDPQYHFSCQFLADLLAMNHADFIISSTYQEIAGKVGGHSLGQYEAFRAFTLPGLIRVTQGIDVFDPRFNIVSPGADEQVYFPFSAADRRLTHFHEEIKALVWGSEEADTSAVGLLAPERAHLPIIFSMARLDKVKNLTGLAEMYVRSPRLQAVANLVVVGGVLNPEHTTDREEADECRKMWALLAEGLNKQQGGSSKEGGGGGGELRGRVRWIVAQRNRMRNGELYRVIADTRGAFVQPALFEAFGLTVVEAMACGLPVFVTSQGGPSEIVKHGSSGFQFDPYHLDGAAELMADFFERCQADAAHWDAISQGALRRVASRYTWRIYASRLLDQACVYSFWRLATDLDRAEAKQYLGALYALKLRPLMSQVPVHPSKDQGKDKEPTALKAT